MTSTRTITQRSISGAVEAITNGDDFSNSGRTLTGRTDVYTFGQLPAEYRSQVGRSNYVIYSYATPIAWRGSDGQWCMPPVRYSVTTSKHQSLVRQILATLDAEVSSV